METVSIFYFVSSASLRPSSQASWPNGFKVFCTCGIPLWFSRLSDQSSRKYLPRRFKKIIEIQVTKNRDGFFFKPGISETDALFGPLVFLSWFECCWISQNPSISMIFHPRLFELKKYEFCHLTSPYKPNWLNGEVEVKLPIVANKSIRSPPLHPPTYTHT